MRVGVRVQPGASQPSVGGEHDGALIVRVRARAINGAATAEALGAIASAFRVRPSAVRLVRGVRSRDKLIEVAGDEVELASRLGQLHHASRDTH